MKDRVFVDSNIFIYAKIKSQDAEKHIGAQSLLRSFDKQVIISVQVLNEFYNTLARIGVDDAIIQSFLIQITDNAIYHNSIHQQIYNRTVLENEERISLQLL